MIKLIITNFQNNYRKIGYLYLTTKLCDAVHDKRNKFGIRFVMFKINNHFWTKKWTEHYFRVRHGPHKLDLHGPWAKYIFSRNTETLYQKKTLYKTI